MSERDQITPAPLNPTSETEMQSARDRKMTEKGREWQIQQSLNNFRAAVSGWRKCANHMQSLLSDTDSISVLRNSRKEIERHMQNVSDMFVQVCAVIPGENNRETTQRYDMVESENHHLLKTVGERIREIEVDKGEVVSAKTCRSHFSRRSNSSRSSQASHTSAKLEALTEAAVLKTKLKHMDAEAKKRAELELAKADFEKFKTIQDLDIAEAKLDAIATLEREDNQLDLGDRNSLPSDGMNSYVEEYVNAHSVPLSSTNCDIIHTTLPLPVRAPGLSVHVPDYSVPKPLQEPNIQSSSLDQSIQFSSQQPIVSFVPFTSTNTQSTWVYPPAINTQSTQVCSPVVTKGLPVMNQVRMSAGQAAPTDNMGTSLNSTEQQFLNLAQSFAEQINISRLPPPEPSVFSGDPLTYPAWKGAFESLIEQKRIPSCERIHYLKKYLSGEAKAAVEGYFLLMTDDAYDEAKALLEERYGDSFVIANAFRNKLEAWPKVQSRDGAGLRKYADFLRQCETAMNSIGSLNVLNDDRENRKMLTKLPDWLVTRWAREVAKSKEQNQAFPPFKEFVRFVTREANIACDPVTSLQALKGEDTKGKPPNPKQTLGARSLLIETNKPDKANNHGKSSRESCLLHPGKGGHELDECRVFLAKPLPERKTFIKDKGLCFGCLKQGHRSKLCRQRKTCNTCAKQHPTSLHGDVRRTPTLDEKGTIIEAGQAKESACLNTSISHQNRVTEVSKSSMILPVWISHKDHPENERLVYAMLDTQSDTTFILDDTCDSLGLDGPSIKLLLSTMLAENQLVGSRKIEGLVVRGYDNEIRIPLPTTFSRKIIPANHSHIPTPEVARQWPHLNHIADKLLPLADCEVGLLIGYNCSRALAPRDVIPPVNNEPYGQRTDLGWGIVGIVDPHQIEENNCDPIGVSHRILACEVPPSLPVSQGRAGTQEHSKCTLFSIQSSTKEIINPSVINKMMELDFSERHSESQAMSQDDKQFLSKMADGIHQDNKGHYEMPLPFKGCDPSLPNNKALALHRLKQLTARFQRDPKYHDDYTAFMERVIKDGHAERVPDSELTINDGHSWYIPHHGVYHPKKPEKIRIVFDCSAKYKGEFLNDHLLQGPDLTNALVGVLCRFRQESVAFMCDIEQMFHQFKVNKEHRNFLRFLWWENGNFLGQPTEYRMTVHLFGAASSPGCANFGLKQVANDHEAQFGAEAANFIRGDFYVDDGLKSVPTVYEAIHLIEQSKKICAEGGLRLHKFMSNSKEVLEAIPPEDRAKGLSNLNLALDSLPIERALGVQWCVESDAFNFRITLKDQPLTRRGVLSTVSSVYDPLGFIAPLILVGKQILQNMCRDSADWDSPLPEHLRSRWEHWRSSLVLLASMKIQRCFKPVEFGDTQSVELHHFSDASTNGYGQCSYLRLKDKQDRVHCSLVMGKARVAPLKPVTIPRLELTAAVISVKVSALLTQELNFSNIKEVFWTDSKVVLGYISNESQRFHVFVANRVQQIRDHTDPKNWHHVKGSENPADGASRGLSAKELLSSNWLTGPDFLWQRDTPFPEGLELTISSEDPEVKRVKVLVSQATDPSSTSILNRLEYFSDWHRAKRAIAVCLKLKANLKSKLAKKPLVTEPRMNLRSHKKSQYQPVSVEEIEQAELEIIRQTQDETFKEEIKILQGFKAGDRDSRQHRRAIKGKSSLFRLDPFLDNDGILRVGGRLKGAKYPMNIKHPVILPRKHHTTELVIQHFHQRCAHQGRGMTTNEIRANGFWIIGCSSAVFQHISKCVKCRKLRGQTKGQKMAELPEDRFQEASPFSYCGVDFFGPWYIKEGRKELKRYGVIFTCLSSRAIHLETANSLNTDSFINALRRFLAVRGPIRLLRSDCGTNLVGARRELAEALSEMDDGVVREFLLKGGCTFEHKLNVPSASHMGGVWERQIRTVRSVLASLMAQAGLQLSDESLRTLMCEVTAIVNSRPLTTDNLNDPTSLVPLTPNHLLTMKSKILLPPPGKFQKNDMYCRKRWRQVQHLANEFWTRWRKEYLQSLQVRQKWIRPQQNLQVGDIVIIKDDDMPRNMWKLGRVQEACSDREGHVRKVKVIVASESLDSKGKRASRLSILERPIHKLILLVEAQK